jgi:drug/metabolite transporter (DMT)-like permease
MPPFTLAFIRFFFAGLLFIPFIIPRWQKMSPKEWLEILTGAFFGISINVAFFFLGIQKAASINAPIIGSAGPVFLYILSIIFLKEIPQKKVIVGMLVALMGVAVIILSPVLLEGKEIGGGEMQGNIYFVIATLGAVIYPLVSKNVLKRINAYQFTGIGFLFGAVTFFPFMLNELQTWTIHFDTPALVGIAYGIFLSSFIAYLFHNIGTARIKAQELGVFSYIDPVAAVLVAIPLIHEIPTLYFYIGSILVLGGIVISEGRLQYHPLQRLFRR